MGAQWDDLVQALLGIFCGVGAAGRGHVGGRLEAFVLQRSAQR